MTSIPIAGTESRVNDCQAQFLAIYPFVRRAAEVRTAAAVARATVARADREDLVQEALVAAWRALPHYDPSRASLRTFIERVVASRIASSVRAARRLPAQAPLSAVGPWPVDSGADVRNFYADIERISSALGCHDRKLVLLLLEHSPAEVGRMLGIPRSTVHDRILRLRRRFVEAGFVPSGGRR